MLGRKIDVSIVPNNDSEFISAKHWLIAKRADYRVIYISTESNEKKPMIITSLTFRDQSLFRKTLNMKPTMGIIFA